MKRLLAATLLVLLALGLGAAAVFWWREKELDAFAATPFGPAEARDVTVPAGSSPRTVATLLARAGIVSDAGLFYRFVRRAEVGPSCGPASTSSQARPPQPKWRTNSSPASRRHTG